MAYTRYGTYEGKTLWQVLRDVHTSATGASDAPVKEADIDFLERRLRTWQRPTGVSVMFDELVELLVHAVLEETRSLEPPERMTNHEQISR